LQIRIWRLEELPEIFVLKSIRRLLPGSHPPSVVQMEKLAMGAVDADPSRIEYPLPPFVYAKKYD
jgi:hypothetical protein